jgi:hypothetical protein
MRWADAAWDDERALLWNPPGSFDEYALPARSVHMVPQSAWYAVGLLLRGETARAERLLHALCDLQYDHPGVSWHGTFARFAEWPRPRESGALEWVDYDPNWRQFLGTTFGLIRRAFELSPATASRLDRAIGLAVAGEPPDRVAPTYSNIALMRAWMAADESYGRQVAGAFDRHGAFDEYGSPTYYGIDLYALALWRRFPPTPWFAEVGERMWSALWGDIARWWHPGLGNLCGPYSRAYGMDMHHYVALLGLWMPVPVVPDLDGTFAHSHDLTLAPVVELLGGGAAIELADADRAISQDLGDGRVATGWIAPGVMIGAERGARFRAEGQYHPATVHWAIPDGTVGWLRLRHRGRLSATAARGVLEVQVHDHHRLGRQPVVVEASHPGTFGGDWVFPGRTIGYDGPPVAANGVIDAGSDETLVLRPAQGEAIYQD